LAKRIIESPIEDVFDVGSLTLKRGVITSDMLARWQHAGT
jgi:hypothetical protein